MDGISLANYRRNAKLNLHFNKHKNFCFVLFVEDHIIVSPADKNGLQIAAYIDAQSIMDNGRAKCSVSLHQQHNEGRKSY